MNRFFLLAFPLAPVTRPTRALSLPSTRPARRRLLAALAATVGVAALRPVRAAPLPQVEVWRDPGCGCCGAWIEHLRAAGFRVREQATTELDAVRARLGMPARYASCHTAKVADYLIEGHVPAADIVRLLAERPRAVGLAVPGMPVGSPGMEVPDGTREPFDTLLVARDGSATVFQAHRGPGGPARRS